MILKKVFNIIDCQKYSPLLLCPYSLRPSYSKAPPAEYVLLSFQFISFWKQFFKWYLSCWHWDPFHCSNLLRQISQDLRNAIWKARGKTSGEKSKANKLENTHVRLEPPQEKRFHDPLGVCYPVFLVVGPLGFILGDNCWSPGYLFPYSG